MGKEILPTTQINVEHKKEKHDASLWLMVWFILNLCLTISSKSYFQFSEFKLPITLSFIHLSTTSTASFIISRFYHEPEIPAVDFQKFRGLYFFSLLFLLNIVFSNLSLKYLTVSLGRYYNLIVYTSSSNN